MGKKITITQGVNGSWFVRISGALEAGFINYDDAMIYIKAKYNDIAKYNIIDIRLTPKSNMGKK